MPRFISSSAVLFACAVLLGACADTTPHHVPPQDPPDYKGVPTDTTPPVMIIAPAKPAQPQ